MKQTKQLAAYGLLISLAFIFSYIESLLPVFFFVPGMKLGLANLAVFCALYLLDFKGACVISLVRILLVALTFSNTFSMLYSLAGGLLSLAVMGLCRRTKAFGPIGVSAAGGTAHNVGQLFMAALVVKNPAVISYLPVLLAAGCLTGALIGLLGGLIIKRLPKQYF